MSTNIPKPNTALVAVFEDLPAAARAVAALHAAGFDRGSVELVTYAVDEQSPEMVTPKNAGTSADSLVNSAEKWGLVGLEVGAASAIIAAITAFPGVGIGMLIAGGLTGAIMGGIAGLDEASRDDRLDLPVPGDYEYLLNQGKKLVVVLGSHDDAQQAKDVLNQTTSIQGHLMMFKGRLFHEHQAAAV